MESTDPITAQPEFQRAAFRGLIGAMGQAVGATALWTELLAKGTVTVDGHAYTVDTRLVDGDSLDWVVFVRGWTVHFKMVSKYVLGKWHIERAEGGVCLNHDRLLQSQASVMSAAEFAQCWKALQHAFALFAAKVEMYVSADTRAVIGDGRSRTKKR